MSADIFIVLACSSKNDGTNIQAWDGGALTRLSDARGEATIEETLQNAARLHRGLKIFYAPAEWDEHFARLDE